MYTMNVVVTSPGRVGCRPSNEKTNRKRSSQRTASPSFDWRSRPSQTASSRNQCWAVRASEQKDKPPSYQTSATELEALQRLSVVVPDSHLGYFNESPAAASAGSAVLCSLMQGNLRKTERSIIGPIEPAADLALDTVCRKRRSARGGRNGACSAVVRGVHAGG